MSWLSSSSQKPDFTGLQIQTSASTMPIPIVWGTSKLSANIVYYNNFQTNSASAGKGGFLSSNSTYQYSVDLIMALSEGPIAGIGTVWKDQSTYALGQLGLSLYNGSTPQSTWGYLQSVDSSQALSYQGTAYVCAASYQLGASANVGNHNFEVAGVLSATGVNGADADPAQVIFDFLTNPQYGVGFDPASIDLTSLYGTGSDASLQTYCRASGIALSPCLTSQEPASSILSRWLQLCNCATIWSSGKLRFIPYGDVAVPAGNNSVTIQVAVPQLTTTGSTSSGTPTITVCAPSAFVGDGGVRYAHTGVGLIYVGGAAPNVAGQYGISPSGVYLFSSNDESKVVVISYTYTVPVAYMPNLTPLYSLDDLDFIDDKNNRDPVQVSRADPFSLPNIQRIECLSRSNQYGPTPVEARDQSQIELYGPRVGSTVTAHEICDDIFVAPFVAQTILQRGLYIRTHFTFKLSWEYCLLDPMDIVTITDPNLGLNQYPIRITSIDEDDKGLFTITAEELSVGVSTPALYPTAGPRGYLPNQNVPAATVNPPLIFEPPPGLTNNSAEIWIGASGGVEDVADPNWGGANVYVSIDDVSYTQIAVISQKLRQGILTTALAPLNGWDTTSTLSVTLSESAGQLTGASASSARQGATLSLVDNELLAYESALLTGSFSYNLTGLQRAMYGTAPQSHAAGAAFCRLDSAIVKYPLPANYVGLTLYFKFQSFNIFGAGLQSLASCAVFPYAPSGQGSLGPVSRALAIGTPLDFGVVTQSPSENDDWGSCSSAAYAVIDLGTVLS